MHDVTADRSRTAIEALLADPDVDPATLLREDPEVVWRLFEVEGGRNANLTSADRGWSEALCQAAADGRLDRARLLAASLDALARTSATIAAAGTSLHMRLEPTLDERIGFADRYLLQLQNPFERTAAWALDRVDELDRAHPLDAERLLGALPPVLAHPRKRTVLATLALLARVAEREPARERKCAAAAAAALVSEAPDIQAAALAFAPPLDALAPFRDFVSPSNRAAIAAAEPPPAPVVDLDALTWTRSARGRARRSSSCRTHRSPFGSPPGAPSGAGRRTAARRARRADRLARRAGRARVLGRRVHGDADRARPRCDRPLLRVAGRLRRAPAAGSATARSRGIPLGSVIRSWGTGVAEDLGPWDPFAARLRELIARVVTGDARPLLALPTHEGGWIDPRVLAARAHGQPLDPHSPDFVTALLRLAPEHRDPALVDGLDGPGAQALRGALGGSRPARDDAGARSVLPASCGDRR